jgi:hypothetical protein
MGIEVSCQRFQQFFADSVAAPPWPSSWIAALAWLKARVLFLVCSFRHRIFPVIVDLKLRP